MLGVSVESCFDINYFIIAIDYTDEYSSKCQSIFEFDVSKRNSPEYGYWRDTVLERDKFCQCCGSEDSLEAHHIFSYNDYPDLRLDPHNGVTLCSDCHHKYNSYFGHKGTGINMVNFLNKFKR